MARTPSFGERHAIIGTILRAIKVTVSLIVTATFIGTIGILGAYFYFAYDLPNIQSLKDYQPPVASEVYADNGEKIGEFWKECRFLVPLQDIPRGLVNAFLASEDARFFEHHGIDLPGIFRAVWEDIKAGSIVQGGSTITQQITRSLLLTRERKFGRKIREVILATRLERNLNKDQILVLYLNQIFLGNRAYGVKAAARNYFQKSLNQLTIAEQAMIAGLSRAPTLDSPTENPERAKARQSYVLQRLRETGKITRAEYEQAHAEVLAIYTAGIDKDFNAQYLPWFTEHVRRLLVAQFGDEKVNAGGLQIHTTAGLAMGRAADRALRWGLERVDRRQGWRGPLKKLAPEEIAPFAEAVHLQAIAVQCGRVRHLPPQPADRECATGPTPTRDGEIHQAVVTAVGNGGPTVGVLVGHNRGVIRPEGFKWAKPWSNLYVGYDDAAYVSNPKGRFAVGDVIEARPAAAAGEYLLVQTPKVQGALFSMETHSGHVKAIAGGYRFEYGKNEYDRAHQALRQPGSSIKGIIYGAALDKGYTYSTPILDAPVAYRVGLRTIWSPKNYGGGFAGGTTFQDDLIHSRNVPTVKIVHSIGLHYLTAFMRKMGLTSPIDKYLSMALGANGVYLNEMVNAYATYPNHGLRPRQTYILRILDPHGAVLEEIVTPPETMSPRAEQFTTGTAPGGFNESLWRAAQDWIKKDGLTLDPQELSVLYGSAIPDGYTITPQTAYLMTRLLEGVVERGTGTRVKALGKPVAGKTGTTNDETDTWFIGFVPDLAAGVWVGFDTIQTIGRGEQGGRTAAPIFLEYMKEATKEMEAKKFAPPEGFPMGQLASLSGGSAAYWTGGTRPEEGVIGIATNPVRDRAVDFFEADLMGGGSTAPVPRPRKSGGREPPGSEF
ncbi:MAG: PBP1A family penicillin-binding protein [Deltaproteobacteria bacterium]|nr:PBP1A family penicillin-binding protein [Deltaproteobacteria bacterium]